MTPAKTGHKDAKKPADSARKTFTGLTDEERAAVREHIEQKKAAARPGSRAEKAAEAEAAVVAKLASMTPSDRAMGERLHAIIKASAPELRPRLWYGMPAYANEDGEVVCFFQDAQKFKTRYSTLGFSDKAKLDEGRMWPTSYALKEITAVEETRIVALVKKALS